MTDDQSFTTSFTVEQGPQQVYDAVIDVRGWWSGQVDGPTDVLGGEFVYTVPQIHMSAMRVVDLVPSEKVSWLVTDSFLTFTEDKEEWTGTEVTFDIEPMGTGSRLTFTHAGLVPNVECYDLCTDAWTRYIQGSLKQLITTGSGRPNTVEGDRAFAISSGVTSDS